MDKRQFQRAEQHRQCCGEKLKEIRLARDFERAASRWSEFLTEHHRWFTKMQQAFQAGPSSAWFGKLKALRRDDPLLAYLQQARHADEHGLDEVAEGELGSVVIGHGAGPVHIKRLEFDGGHMILKGTDNGRPIIPIFMPAHLKLNPVTNRDRLYQPPRASIVRPPLDGAKPAPLTALEAGTRCMTFMAEKSAEGLVFLQQVG